MHHAVTFFGTEYCMSPILLGPAVEERGFESLWVAEHSHIPASRLSPWPGGAELPQFYYDAMDPFGWLSAAAAVTTTLKVATGICLVVQRDPIQTAKQVASLDQISGGRFLFGIGAGWNIEEMNNHGTNGEGRFKLMRERIEAMKEIWTKDEASYAGEHVSFDRIIANPKPVQKPHPPIHVGGAFPGGSRRAVRYADGWIPIGGREDMDFPEMVRDFRAMAEEAGRDPDELEISIFAVPPDGDFVKRCEDAGVSRVVYGAPPAGADVVLPFLDTLAGLR
ncbi:MAG: LLM class F420-dependent oxidoreductase [bacterium]|nr:LLM class F420-dependent oxidoreductase [bacterium]